MKNVISSIASQNNDLGLVKLLLAFGADVNMLNGRGKTPFDIYFENCHSQNSLCKMYDDLMKLLKDCGGITGKKQGTVHFFNTKRQATKVFRRVQTGLIKDRKEKDIVNRNCLRERSYLESDWCVEVAKLYYQTWMAAMAYPPPLLSKNLEEAAALGAQIRMMRLVQVAGSRILVLDGGGMKGLIEVEILEQIEKVTGRRIVELFDWIVGTSIGSIIALALVYGKV